MHRIHGNTRGYKLGDLNWEDNLGLALLLKADRVRYSVARKTIAESKSVDSKSNDISVIMKYIKGYALQGSFLQVAYANKDLDDKILSYFPDLKHYFKPGDAHTDVRRVTLLSEKCGKDFSSEAINAFKELQKIYQPVRDVTWLETSNTQDLPPPYEPVIVEPVIVEPVIVHDKLQTNPEKDHIVEYKVIFKACMACGYDPMKIADFAKHFNQEFNIQRLDKAKNKEKAKQVERYLEDDTESGEMVEDMKRRYCLYIRGSAKNSMGVKINEYIRAIDEMDVIMEYGDYLDEEWRLFQATEH